MLKHERDRDKMKKNQQMSRYRKKQQMIITLINLESSLENKKKSYCN